MSDDTADDSNTGEPTASEPTADDSTAGEPSADEPTGDEPTTEELPDPLREHLYAVVERLVESEGMLVALDFDGTLAAIEDRPDEATIPDETRKAVEALAGEPNVEVAIVSGRELADVRERVGVSASNASGGSSDESDGVDEEAVSYAGNHGLEIHASEYEIHPEAREAEEDIAHITEVLSDQLAEIEGVVVEDKGVTATVHHRLVPDEDVPTVENAVESLVASRDDVRLTTGKDVLELRPAVEWDKGEALLDLRDELVPDDEEWLAAYVGDDTTDEAAFRVLGDRGLAVKVGDDPETEAPYRVADPEAVRIILDWLDTYGVSFLRADDYHDVPTDRT